MKISGKTLLRIFVSVVIFACIGFGYFVCSFVNTIDRTEKGYRRIRIGDSKERVLEILGKPDEIKPCRPANTVPVSCKEIYGYIVPFGSKGIYFDTDGKVIDKREAASG
jgi:hypothetical protein